MNRLFSRSLIQIHLVLFYTNKDVSFLLKSICHFFYWKINIYILIWCDFINIEENAMPSAQNNAQIYTWGQYSLGTRACAYTWSNLLSDAHYGSFYLQKVGKMEKKNLLIVESFLQERRSKLQYTLVSQISVHVRLI